MDMTMQEFLKALNKSDVVRKTVSLGLGMGLPMINIVGENVCVSVPYYKVVPAKDDKTLIYPPECIVTAKWPNGIVTGFSNLRYDKDYQKVNFDKPVGTFRHEAIKQWNRGEYQSKKMELYTMYDEFLASLYSDEPYTGGEAFSELLNIIIEPSLRPFYQKIGKGFYNKFLSQ
jgi:hypothetical protein